MSRYIIKILLSAVLLASIAELSKRNLVIGAFLASLPLTSLLAFVWLYWDTGDTEKIAELSASIFWLVLPSLVLFQALPALLRWGCGFWIALGMASVLTALSYWLTLKLQQFFDVV